MSDVESDPPVEEDERDVALEASQAMLELLLERPLYATVNGDKASIDEVDEIVAADASRVRPLYDMQAGRTKFGAPVMIGA